MISARTQILFGRSSLILYFVQYHVSFCLFPSSVATFILIEICKYLNVADWTDIYGMHQRTILRSSYRGIAWVRFDPMKTDFVWTIAFVNHFVYFSHMSVAEWTDTYNIYHQEFPRSSYRKLSWVGFDPATTEFHSGTLTNWTIWLWLQHAPTAKLVELVQFHSLFSIRFHFGYCLR